MARYRGRRSTRRKNLQRNLARLRERTASDPAVEALPDDGPLDLPPDRPGDLANLARDVLTGALRLTRLERGIISLRIPACGGRYRVVQRMGFKNPATDLTGMLRVMGHCIQTRKPAQFHGDLLIAAPSRMGTTVAVPLLLDGKPIGALILDDPERTTSLAETTSSQLLDFARHSAAILGARLARPARRLSA